MKKLLLKKLINNFCLMSWILSCLILYQFLIKYVYNNFASAEKIPGFDLNLIKIDTEGHELEVLKEIKILK